MKRDDSLTRFLGLRAYAVDSDGVVTHRGLIFEVTRDRGNLAYTLGVLYGLPLTARTCVDDWGNLVGWDAADLPWGDEHSPRLLVDCANVVLADPLPEWGEEE